MLPLLLALLPLGGQQSPAVERPPTPIARAVAAAPGDTITIAGRALAGSGEIQRGGLDVALDDGTGALRVFSRAAGVTVHAGDSVVATGLVRTYRGDRELLALSARVVVGAGVAPRLVEPRAIAILPESLAAAWGRLVSVRGHVAGYGRSEGGEWLRLRGLDARDSAHAVTVWVGATHGGGVRLASFRDDDRVQVTGIVTAFRDTPEDSIVWQIVPRRSADVVALDGRWLERARTIALWLAGVLLVVAAAVRIAGRRQARELRDTEARYRQLLELMPDAVIVHDGARILFTNPAAARLLALPDDEALIGRALADVVAAESRALVVGSAPPASAPVDAAPSRGRGRLLPAGGEGGAAVDVEVTTSPCRYNDRAATLVLARDITQQLRVERDLESLALLDELTGLHNRRGFTLFAEQELARARRYGRAAVLLFADMDGLKRINDEHGHAAGDLALKAVARALRSVVREADVVARWAGDEFVALLLEGADGGEADFQQRLTSALDAHAGLPFPVRATVGTSRLDPDDVTSLAEALEQADVALYARKRG